MVGRLVVWFINTVWATQSQRSRKQLKHMLFQLREKLTVRNSVTMRCVPACVWRCSHQLEGNLDILPTASFQSVYQHTCIWIFTTIKSETSNNEGHASWTMQQCHQWKYLPLSFGSSVRSSNLKVSRHIFLQLNCPKPVFFPKCPSIDDYVDYLWIRQFVEISS